MARDKSATAVVNRTEQPPVADKGAAARTARENFIRVWAPTLVTALFIITFNVQAFEIPSGSMENTLLIGDHLLVDRVRFAPESHYLDGLVPYRGLQHGDIVVFMSVLQPGLHLVKRVIGVPGDHIKLVNKVVYRNGAALDEPYARRTPVDCFAPVNDPARDNWPNGGPLPQEDWAEPKEHFIQNGEVVVPPHSYFMMGDNRLCSYDSRYWGFVPEKNLIGRPIIIYWSYQSTESDYQYSDMADRIKSLFSVIAHFPTRTRWSRTLRLVR